MIDELYACITTCILENLILTLKITGVNWEGRRCFRSTSSETACVAVLQLCPWFRLQEFAGTAGLSPIQTPSKMAKLWVQGKISFQKTRKKEKNLVFATVFHKTTWQGWEVGSQLPLFCIKTQYFDRLRAAAVGQMGGCRKLPSCDDLQCVSSDAAYVIRKREDTQELL